MFFPCFTLFSSFIMEREKNYLKIIRTRKFISKIIIHSWALFCSCRTRKNIAMPLEKLLYFLAQKSERILLQSHFTIAPKENLFIICFVVVLCCWLCCDLFWPKIFVLRIFANFCVLRLKIFSLSKNDADCCDMMQ